MMRNSQINYLRLRLQLIFTALVIFAAGIIVGWLVFSSPERAGSANTALDIALPTGLQRVPYGNMDRQEKARSWELMLINAANPLPENYKPELEYIENNEYFDVRAASSLKEMLSAMRAEGFEPCLVSGYRTLEEQRELYVSKLNEYLDCGYDLEDATREAGTRVAFPGTSEHNAGLAADISDSGSLEDESSLFYDWLRDNCHIYGFILRYPEGKTEITGIIYEPWHFRYVGVDAATVIMQKRLCLEEYLLLANM